MSIRRRRLEPIETQEKNDYSIYVALFHKGKIIEGEEPAPISYAILEGRISFLILSNPPPLWRPKWLVTTEPVPIYREDGDPLTIKGIRVYKAAFLEIETRNRNQNKGGKYSGALEKFQKYPGKGRKIKTRRSSSR